MEPVKVLLFKDVGKAVKFLRRHGSRVVQVIIVVSVGGGSPGRWEGAMKTNYGAHALSGLIILHE